MNSRREEEKLPSQWKRQRTTFFPTSLSDVAPTNHVSQPRLLHNLNENNGLMMLRQGPPAPEQNEPKQQHQQQQQRQQQPQLNAINDASTEQAMVQLYAALKMLPTPDRAACEEALLRVPLVVEEESNPLAFLSSQKWNVAAAAQRFAAYWTMRRAELGKDDAFRPLKELLDVGRDGRTSILDPRFSELPAHDDEGRRVFRLAVGSLHGNQNKSAVPPLLNMKSVFHSLSTQAQKEPATTGMPVSSDLTRQEMVLIIRWVVGTFNAETAALARVDMRFQHLLAFAIPWRVTAIHFTVITTASIHNETSHHYDQDQSLSAQSLISSLNLIPPLEKLVQLHQVTDAVAKDSQHLKTLLESFGITLRQPSMPVTGVSPAKQPLAARFQGLHQQCQVSNQDGATCQRQAMVESGDRKMSPEERNRQRMMHIMMNQERDTTTPSHDEGRSMHLDEELLIAMRQLPDETKAAYLDAVSKCPELVLRESNPTWFLERENQDIWAAALRLAQYWEKRKELFGDEKAFLPLDLSGAGALDACDVDTIASGVLAPLTNSDRSLVYLFDRSRFAGGPVDLQKSLLRSLFYWGFRIMNNATARSEGITAVGVVNMQGNNLGRLDAKHALDLVQDAFPIKIKVIHLCLAPHSANDGLMLLKQTVVPQLMKRLMSFRSFECHVHTGKITSNRMLNGIQLPKSLGGTWSYDHFDAWVGNQRTLDSADHSDSYSNESHRANNGGSSTKGSKGLLTSSARDSSIDHAEVNRQQFDQANGRSAPFHGARNISPVEQPIDVQREGLRRLEEAIDILPEEENSAYIRATIFAPQLVQIESNPLKFLLFEKYDAWSAARRLAHYWKTRVDIFGSRAFLPLTLSGKGALSEQDICLFLSGYISFLPNDDRGRCVICYDPGKRTDDSFGVRMRLNFYAMSVCSENDLSASEGLVTILVLGGGQNLKGSTVDVDGTAITDVTMKAFPLNMHTVHIASSLTGIGQRLFFEVLLPLALNLMRHVWKERYLVHSGPKDLLFRKLCSYGLVPSCIPISLGGTWTNQDHCNWVQERIRVENERYSFMISPSQNSINQSPTVLRRQSEQTNQVPDASGAENLSLGNIRSIDSGNCVQGGLGDLAKAIELIPLISKSAYMKALAEAPQLISRESNPASFLVHERFNVVAAARRLVKYWEVRVEIFESRAFLPLDQTGEGALDRRDLAALGTSYLMCLPKDSHGRAVIFCDGTRLSKSTRQSRLRTSFYMYSIAAETEISQTDGLILLYVATEPSFDRANKESLDLVLSAIPAGIRDVHLLKYPASTSEDWLSDKIDAASLHEFRQIAKNQVVQHITRSRTSIAEKLEPYGMTVRNLPRSIGGDFGFDRFFQWQELRTRFEWDLPSGFVSSQDTGMFDFSAAKPLTQLNEQEKQERRRRQNVIHSRRQRERERIEVEVLNEQIDELWDKKKDLERENVHLLELVKKAKVLIQPFSGV